MDRAPRVVVGVCGTLGGTAALQHGVREAERRGAVLVPLTAWEPSRQEGPRPLSELEHAARRRMDTAFARTFAGYPPDLLIHPLIVRGDAGPALVAAADGPDDLLVVGTGGHRTLRRAPAGSVTRYCRAHAHCPVLVVTPSNGTPGRRGAGVDPTLAVEGVPNERCAFRWLGSSSCTWTSRATTASGSRRATVRSW
ncbi:universal stress protein [Kitasatospora sp. NPDC004272]